MSARINEVSLARVGGDRTMLHKLMSSSGMAWRDTGPRGMLSACHQMMFRRNAISLSSHDVPGWNSSASIMSALAVEKPGLSRGWSDE